MENVTVFSRQVIMLIMVFYIHFISFFFYFFFVNFKLKEEEMERCISDLTGNMIKNLRGSAVCFLLNFPDVFLGFLFTKTVVNTNRVLLYITLCTGNCFHNVSVRVDWLKLGGISSCDVLIPRKYCVGI